MRKLDYDFDYNDHIIFLTLAGSRAYGTNNEQSDYDYRGVIIPPTEIMDGFRYGFDEAEGLEGYGEDSKAYDIRKFIDLATQCNPNIIELLFATPELLVIDTQYGELLRSHKNEFLSKQAFGRFGGYAKAQLDRIKRHKRWWDQENAGDVPERPTRESFGLPSKPRFGKDQLAAIMAMPQEMILAEHREYIALERKYKDKKSKYDDWAKWKTNRNEKRAQLESQFGYDTKHAMHLVRLLCMCGEILTDHQVLVRRPDAQFLLSIRNGAWTYEQLMEWVEEKEAMLQKAYESSTLPDRPDAEKLNELCVELVQKARREGFGKKQIR